jgi:hypothetical protein
MLYDHAKLKSNKIWTKITMSTSRTPAFMLENKLLYAVQLAPQPKKWLVHAHTLIEDNMIECIDIYAATDELVEIDCYEAYYPSDDINEHMVLMSKLRYERINDPFSIDNIHIIDARVSIIGKDVPPSEPIPIIYTKDVLTGTKLHRTPGDNHQTSYIQRDIQLNGTILHQAIDLGSIQHRAYICKIKYNNNPNIYNQVTLMYLCEGIILEVEDEPFIDTMTRIREHHIRWLTERPAVHREMFMKQAQTYEKDISSYKNGQVYQAITLLCQSYADNQWSFYKCQNEKPSYWRNCSIHEMMDIVYAEHLDWLESKTSLDHNSHIQWTKAYDTDPIMPQEWKLMLKPILNAKLQSFVDQLSGSAFIDNHQHRSIQYMQSPVVFRTERTIKDVPYFLL